MKELCQLCKESLVDDSDTYEYRGFVFHEKCFDEGIEKVDAKRSEISQVVDHSIRSQADGEWQSGGYKTMKVSTDGRPITKVKEPQILKDYEKGIL